MTKKGNKWCCEKCYDVYWDKTYPMHTPLPACMNEVCPCHYQPIVNQPESDCKPSTPIQREGWETKEYEDAIRWADEFLDEPYADPDDEIRTVARQFLRSIERYDRFLSHTQDTIRKVEGMKGRHSKNPKASHSKDEIYCCLDCHDEKYYDKALTDVLSLLREEK